MAETHPALICAYDIAEDGSAIALSWEELDNPIPQGRWRWIHLDRTHEETGAWLARAGQVPALAAEALLAEETRPRVFALEHGHIAILRGINHNPDFAPEDMVSIRLWIEDRRIISLRRMRLLAIQDLRAACDGGTAPGNIGGFLADLASALLRRMSPVVLDLEDDLDAMEETGVALPTARQRERLVALCRRAIPLRRYLSPQRDALSVASNLKADWLDADSAARIREAFDQASRLVEALDAVRERAGLLHEEFANRLAERTNRNMYVLTVVAAIFLPLGLLTGLLGINVGGIPGTDNPWAFATVAALIVAIGIAEFAYLRSKGWI